MPASRRDQLTPRQACILGAIVEEYVHTAAPVGSKAVRERHGVGASTATIRNEMSILERDGYIHQPHTSAGRVPGDKGYRTYVDEIMPARGPRVEELSWVRSEYRRSQRLPEQLYRTTSRVLSQLTSAPAMVMAPPDEHITLTDLRLTPVSSSIIRLTYSTQPGGTIECLVSSSEPLSDGQVAALAQTLVKRYCGREVGAFSLCSADTLQDDLAPHPVPTSLLETIKVAVERDRVQHVYVDGTSYALKVPEHRQLEQLEPVMEALDEEMIVRRLLRPAARRGRLTVIIGEEHEVRGLSHCSVIARHYRGESDGVGALGVLGPTRMDYQAVIAAVNCVADQIAQILSAARDRESDES